MRRRSAPDGHKWCTRCGLLKSYDEYYNNRRSADGKEYACKACRLAADTRDHYEKTYGVPRTQIDQMFSDQGGRCAVCIDPLGAFHFDHCHASGKARGLLCHSCNVALGHLRDDPVRIQRLLMYLLERGG